MQHQDILTFWFPDGDHEARNKLWFGKNDAVDELIRIKFGALLSEARTGGLQSWRETPPTLLAYIILLDQFSRNVYRNSPEAFAADKLALGAAKHAVASGMDKSLSLIERAFVYLPYEHSEDLTDQNTSVELYGNLKEEASEEDRPVYSSYLDYAVAHQKIIARFGRFPHRNAVLGRISTAEELAFLKEPGSSF